MKAYQLRVTIIGIPKLYKILEASEKCTFNDFHDAIFQAFDRFDYHLYVFFIPGKDTKNFRIIYDAPEIRHPQNVENFMGFGKRKESTAKTRIGDIGLNENDVIHYLFDFGDEWWHRIKLQNIYERKSKRKHLKLIKSVDESPPQYQDYDEDYDEEDE